MIPMGRLGAADELASSAAFFASDESGFITGIESPVDGGAASKQADNAEAGESAS